MIVILPLILGAAMMALNNSAAIQDQASTAIVANQKLRTTLRRIANELRTSSQTAEDGVDLNGNGRQEEDWAVTPTSITFNRMLGDRTYSLPITYALNGTDLVRSRMIDASGTMETVVIATSIANFTVIAAGSQITVNMVVSINQAGGVVINESSSITVEQRN